ncbi:hypothetical protein SNEBB_000895 [Seison nebaliae]|nr:hypothetical protein SNEBB_000895 [Seison nebaliae]
MGISCDDEYGTIDRIYLLKLLPWYLHWNILPFFLIYPTWIFIWLSYFGLESYKEFGLIVIGCLASLQILMSLFAVWMMKLRAFMTCTSVKELEDANLMFVKPTKHNGTSEIVHLIKEKKDIYFHFQKVKYVFDGEEKFCSIRYPIDLRLMDYVESRGLDDEKIGDSMNKYGLNKLILDIPTFLDLFVERATMPFFVFQSFCVLLWCLDEYWHYALFTLIMLIIFELLLVKQQLTNLQTIRNMGNKPYMVNVYRNRKWLIIMSDELLPGDICSLGRRRMNDNQSTKDKNNSQLSKEINNNRQLRENDEMKQIPCDMLLLRGNCIIDESMLTGESCPVTKEPIMSLDEKDLNESFIMESMGKLHILYAGTRILANYPSVRKQPNISWNIRTPDNGCLCYVVRTGYETSQGRLMKTILYGVQRISANNKEVFLFILFLLIFAIMASSYIWIEGTKNPERNKYKLFVECILVLTSVVPPELPVELSVAVNSSISQLQKNNIFCTEPFRIPFAGKIDICCFDKTGTLTSEKPIIKGIAYPKDNLNDIRNINDIIRPINSIDLKTFRVLLTCHSLMAITENGNNDIVGDPLEKGILSSLGYYITRQSFLVHNRNTAKQHLNDLSISIDENSLVTGESREHHDGNWKIIHRHHFTSALKRMSTVSVNNENYIGSVKGAPEIIRSMFKIVPENYDETYQQLMCNGARILALAYKQLPNVDNDIQAGKITRDELEYDLEFAGFLVVATNLKSDTASAIKEIIHASHDVMMITGDNPLTAAFIARQLNFVNRFNLVNKHFLVLDRNDTEWNWKSINESEVKYFPFNEHGGKDLVTKSYDLCVTGEGLQMIQENGRLKEFLPIIRVFARTSPKQKQFIISHLNEYGLFTLMCGDGTNDVGALKHAHVGIALITEKAAAAVSKRAERNQLTIAQHLEELRRLATEEERNEHINQMKNMMEEDRIVKLGDASIAAPITSKNSSIKSVCEVLKHGRATLVSTLQMFHILALNALITAYSRSVLYLAGVKFGETQATVQGVMLTFCYLTITQSKPLNTISRKRPLNNIFNIYMIGSIFLQFAVHLSSLLYLVQLCNEYEPRTIDENQIIDEEFKPNLLNSTLYIISIALELSTFIVNYRGRPFMLSMKENTPFLMAVLACVGYITIVSSPLMQFGAENGVGYLDMIEMPVTFRYKLYLTLLADVSLAFILDRIWKKLFDFSPKKELI